MCENFDFDSKLIRLYSITAALFVFQWMFDEAQMKVDSVGAPVTPQQWDYIHQMGAALRSSLENVTAVFAPPCIGHSVLTKRDWMNIKIDDISLVDALRCWERSTRKHKRKNNGRRHVDDELNRMEFVEMDNGRNVTAVPHRRRHHLTPEERLRRRQQMTPEERERRRLERRRRKMQRKNRQNEVMQPNNGRRKKNEQNNDRNERIRPRNENRAQPNNRRSNKRKRNRVDAEQKSVSRRRKYAEPQRCSSRLLERCSWPQCNRSCPALTNPLTGEEVSFIDLLKSFGLNIEAVAAALGMSMQALYQMDHSELVMLLTQQVSK